MTRLSFALFYFAFFLAINYTHQTVSLIRTHVNDTSTTSVTNSTLKKKELTYMTLIEGTNDIYEVCKLICETNDMKTYYSETTVYPGYGKMFRCQCNDDFTPWYNLNTFAEITMDLLKGNDFFNYYLNMPGNYQNECVCTNLKNLVFNILGSFKDVSPS